MIAADMYHFKFSAKPLRPLLPGCILILVGLLCCLPEPAQAQNYNKMQEELNEKQKQTKKEIANLQKQIDSYQQRLSQTTEEYERVYDQYEDLKKEISLRNALIEKRQEELNHIQEEIKVIEEELRQNQKRLQELIEEYKKTLRYVYKHGRSSRLALLLTAESLNQMNIRSYYLELFEQHRQEQAQTIREAQADLDSTKAELEQQEKDKEEVLATIKSEQDELQQRIEKQEAHIATLRENRSKLRSNLDEVKKQSRELNNTLTELIAREEKIREAQRERLRRLEEERKERLAAARQIQDEEKRKKEVEKYSDPVTDEEYMNKEQLDSIERQFANSKGELPWPANGVISEKFGTQVHPVYGTKITNHGIEIATEAQTTVRVIHEGYVSAIRPIPGYGDVVLVNHGRFKTAYGNLSQVMVSKNRQLRKGDIIGLSGEEGSPRGKTVFFMIRENDTNLNPEQWIVSK